MKIEKLKFPLIYEILTALAESKADLKNGRYHEDSVDEHIKRIVEKK